MVMHSLATKLKAIVHYTHFEARRAPKPCARFSQHDDHFAVQALGLNTQIPLCGYNDNVGSCINAGRQMHNAQACVA